MLYVLRHEERDDVNPLFDSPLTENGFENSKKLVPLLQRLEIDTIYCSPFLRVVQTIHQYCLQTNKHIKLLKLNFVRTILWALKFFVLIIILIFYN